MENDSPDWPLKEAVIYWQEKYLQPIADDIAKNALSGIDEHYAVVLSALYFEHGYNFNYLNFIMHEFDCKLSMAALRQNVKFTGKIDTEQKANETIPNDYFTEPRGFCAIENKIEPHPTPFDDATLFSDAISRDQFTWFNVLVERAGYKAWLAAEYPSTAAALPPHECDAPTLSGKAAGEQRAIKHLTTLLRQNPELKKPSARNAIKDFNISEKGFLTRVWPNARISAGLSPIARSGAPKKNSNAT